MDVIQVWLFCAALFLFCMGLACAWFYRKDILEFFATFLYRLRGIGRSLHGIGSTIEESVDDANVLKIATTNFNDTNKVLHFLSTQENKQLQYVSHLKTKHPMSKDVIKFVNFDKFMEKLSEEFSLTECYRMWGRIFYRVHKPGTIFYVMVDSPVFLENKRINYNLDLADYPGTTLVVDQVQFACNPQEGNIKEDYLNEVYESAAFICKILPTNFKEKANIFIPVFGQDNRYSFKRVTINAFNKFFDSNMNLNYNNFDIQIGAATLSCSPMDTFQYCCELLTHSNDNLFLQGPPGTGKTSYMSMLKSKLSNTPNCMVFSLDAQVAASLFNNPAFSETMANFIQESDFRKRNEDTSEEVKMSYIFFIEDGDALLSSVLDENGKKTVKSSAILDMLDGEKKLMYNMKFVLSSNTPIESYDEVIQRRFKRCLSFTPLTTAKAADKLQALEESIAREKEPKFYIDHVEVEEILKNSKQEGKGVLLSDIYLRCRKTIQEKTLLLKFEQKLLDAVESSGKLEKVEFLSLADKLDGSVKATLSVKDAAKNFEVSVKENSSEIELKPSDAPKLELPPVKKAEPLPKAWAGKGKKQ